MSNVLAAYWRRLAVVVYTNSTSNDVDRDLSAVETNGTNNVVQAQKTNQLLLLVTVNVLVAALHIALRAITNGLFLLRGIRLVGWVGVARVLPVLATCAL